MADESDNDNKPGARPSRSNRRPPTIDLRATEVPPTDAPKEGPTATPGPATEALSPGPPAGATPESAANVNAAPSPSDTSPPPADSTQHDGGDLPPPPSSTPPRTDRWLPSLIGGAVAGGVVAALLLLAAWFTWGEGESGAALSRQAKRIDTIEAKVRDLAARKPSASVDPAALDALKQRLDKLETAANAPRPAPADKAANDRFAALEKSLGGLKDSVAALQQRSDKTTAAVADVRKQADNAAASAENAQSARDQGSATVRQEVDSLTGRLSTLEHDGQSLRADLAKQQASLATQASQLAKAQSAQNEMRALRLAMVTESLKFAVARGEQYRDELDAAKALASDPTALTPLDAFAGTGVPSAQELGRELRAILPAIRRLATPQSSNDNGFFDRLQANAERLVRIRPLDEQSDDDPNSVLGRLETRAQHGNIGGALAELDKLPEAARAPAAAWIKKAKARDAALDASQRFAGTAIAALARRPD